jgi:hypothetical protein
MRYPIHPSPEQGAGDANKSKKSMMCSSLSLASFSFSSSCLPALTIIQQRDGLTATAKEENPDGE